MKPHQRVLEILIELPRGGEVTEADLRRHVSAICAPAFFAALEDAPRFKDRTRKQANEEIEKYARLCRDLGQHIHSMGSQTHRALGGQPLNLLDSLVQAVATAHSADLDDTREKSGAGEKMLAREVTGAAAAAYEAITGQEGKRRAKDGKAYGPYLEFLGSIFKALGIKASPESQARMEKMRP